jgi:hypothetical protein
MLRFVVLNFRIVYVTRCSIELNSGFLYVVVKHR